VKKWGAGKAEIQFRTCLPTQDFAAADITASSVRQTVLLPVLFFLAAGTNLIMIENVLNQAGNATLPPPP
jgi:hypothetical protein